MKRLLLLTLSFVSISTTSFAHITKDDVLKAQQQWADGIVHIGDIFTAKGDYKAAAMEHIETLYAYDMGGVLFKPTLASQDQFRETLGEAHSYFVGGVVEEDKGFAIKPWKAVRFGEQQIIVEEDYAIAMGNYYFTPANGGAEQKVEFTFKYIATDNDDLKINVHHSSLPYNPN